MQVLKWKTCLFKHGLAHQTIDSKHPCWTTAHDDSRNIYTYNASQDWGMTTNWILPGNFVEGLDWVRNILTPEAISMFL